MSGTVRQPRDSSAFHTHAVCDLSVCHQVFWRFTSGSGWALPADPPSAVRGLSREGEPGEDSTEGAALLDLRRARRRAGGGGGASSCHWCTSLQLRSHLVRRRVERVLHLGDEVRHDGRVGERRDVPELVRLAARDLAQDPAHDLATARLGQTVCADDGVGRRDAANLLSHSALEFLDQRIRLLEAISENAVGEDPNALDVVRHADNRRLHARGVRDEGRLDLGGAKPMPRHVQHVVHAPRDPDVTVLVTTAAIASKVVVGVGLEVRREVTLVVAVD
mmetsp:Transcript_12750/g.33259  ORF Transcript_12750/g.33259 Transcript_12750/m.33259 type:complete len:277 (-) Transcript_12750:1010-1840(-)